MLTPDYLLHVSEGAEEIAAQLHTDIISRIVERILLREQRGEEYILTSIDKWQIEALMEAGYMREDIEKEIAYATAHERQEIKEAFEDAGVKTVNYDDQIYKSAGMSTPPIKQSPYFTRIMQRNYEATLGEWMNYTRTTADAAQQAFINTMDRIYNSVLSGNIGYTQAYAEAIMDLAKEGIFSVAYPTGHVDSIEVATLRCVRTGVSQASAQVQEARMNEMGIDLVLVSSHLGARPSHQVWQGKIYSRSGTSRKYPDFVSSTGYGTGAGLCGWNCRHNFGPYIEGMENPFVTYDSEDNQKRYDDEQKQRSMERAIRKTKREEEVLRRSFDYVKGEETSKRLNEKYHKVRERLKRQNEAYKEYCLKKDFRPLPERLKIAKTNRER